METARLLRVKPNAGWTSVEILVPSTDPSVSGVKFEPLTAPEISVEKEAGNYTIGSTTVVVSGLAEGVLSGLSDRNQPWIFAWTPTGGAETWGIVREARFNRKTRRTTMMVLSAETLVKEAAATPGRTVYTVKARRVESHVAPATEITTHLTMAGNTVVNPGDVAVFETPFGEHRAPLTAGQIGTDAQGFKTLTIPVPFSPRGLIEVVGAWEGDAGSYVPRFRIDDPAEAQALFDVLPATEETNPDNDNNTFLIHRSVTGDGLKAEFLKADGSVVATREAFQIVYSVPTPGAVAYAFVAFAGTMDPAIPAATAMRLQQSAVQKREEVELKILGRETYGYAAAVGAPYQSDVLATALLSLGYGNVAGADPEEGRPLGIFPLLLGSVAVTGGADMGVVPVEAELADSAIEALRQIQNRARCLLRFLPRFVGGLPKVDAEFIPRAALEGGGSVTAVALADVIAWEEDVAPAELKAVVVKPNHPYFAPKGYEPIGWWFEDANGATPETLTAAQRARRGAPTGRGVLEMELPVMPAYGAPSEAPGALAFRGAINDSALREHAEYFFNWFKETSRAVSGTLRGPAPDVVGRIVSVSEGEGVYAFSKSVFVTTVREGAGGRTTDFDGFVLDTFYAGDPVAPVAVISGAGVHADRDGNGSEVVRLDAFRTHSPSGGALTYTWTVTARGGGVVFTSADRAVAPTLAVGTYDVSMTASGAGGSDTATAVVQVVTPEYEPSTGGEADDVRAVNTEQFELEGGGANKGYLRVYPVYPGEVSGVTARRSVGEEFAPIDWSAVPTPTPAEIWPIAGLPGTDARGDYYEFVVDLDPSGLSYIEARVAFNDANLAPNIVRVSFDADKVASFVSSSLSLSGNGQVILNVKGDNDTANDATAVKVTRIVQGTTATAPSAASYDAPTFNGAAVTTTDHSNPINDLALTTLSEGETVFVRVMLKSRSSGAYDAVTYHQQARTGIGEDVAVRSVTFQDSERTAFPAPANGLFFFDNEGAEIGFNYRVAGAWDRLMSFSNSTTFLDARYVNVEGDTMTGALTLPTLNVTGGGTTAVATIASGVLDVSGAATRFRLDARFDGKVESPAFVSGAFGAGWRIDPNATGGTFFEIDNMRIRGELRTHIFRYDEVHATNGYLYIAAASEVTRDYSGGTIYTRDPVFASGDLVWLKSLNHTQPATGDSNVVLSRKFTINSGPTRVADGSDWHYSYTTTSYSGSGTIPAGSTAVRVGSSVAARDGSIFFDASSQYAPFMDVYDGVNSWTDFHNASKLKVRVGNLDGLTESFGSNTMGGHGFYGERVYLKAGASWMLFDGTFQMDTPNLQVDAAGKVTLGSNLVFSGRDPIISALNDGTGTLQINASRVKFTGTGNTVPAASLTGLTAQLPVWVQDGSGSTLYAALEAAINAKAGETVISGGLIQAHTIVVTNAFAENIYGTSAVFTGEIQADAGTFTGTVHATNGSLGNLEVTEQLSLASGAALNLGNGGVLSMTSGARSVTLGGSVSTSGQTALPQAGGQYTASQTQLASGTSGDSSGTATWTKNGGGTVTVSISVSVSGADSSVNVGGTSYSTSGQYTTTLTGGTGTASISISATAGAIRGNSASVTVSATQAPVATNAVFLSTNSLLGVYATDKEVSMSFTSGRITGSETVYNSLDDQGSVIARYRKIGTVRAIQFEEKTGWNGSGTVLKNTYIVLAGDSQHSIVGSFPSS